MRNRQSTIKLYIPEFLLPYIICENVGQITKPTDYIASEMFVGHTLCKSPHIWIQSERVQLFHILTSFHIGCELVQEFTQRAFLQLTCFVWMSFGCGDTAVSGTTFSM